MAASQGECSQYIVVSKMPGTTGGDIVIMHRKIADLYAKKYSLPP
jgi:hypothetical protein